LVRGQTECLHVVLASLVRRRGRSTRYQGG
jgi:hypothetical protein